MPKLEGGAEVGDYLTADLTFIGPDGEPLDELKEVQFRLQPELRFQDGTITGVGAALAGAARARRARSRPSSARRSRSRSFGARRSPVKVLVHDLKRLRLPELNEAFLDSIGFDSIAELREAVRETLERRIESEQRQAMRRQIVDQLIAATPFELPADLVSREERTTIRRLVAQLKRGGMTDKEIRASEAQIRANAHESTLRSLKELLAAGRDRRCRGDRGRGRRRGARDRSDRRADRRERSPGPRPTREGRGARLADDPDPRAQGHRSHPRRRR